jgi:Ser/Thr protein kinase RdoA (MazF antagonist)
LAVPLDSIPRFSAVEAERAARELFGIEGAVSPLPSERDQNFLIADPVRGKLVLKIANRDDGAALLDFQHQAMSRVAQATCAIEVPRTLASRSGEGIAVLRTALGAPHCVRVLSWLDGALLADVRPRGRILLESIGAAMAQVDLALEGFVHPAMHRALQWDLRRAGAARDKAPLLEPRWRARVEAAFERWDEIDWTSLRQQVIHGDANDHNVLVGTAPAGEARMCGLLDFGDMVYSATVCELAIAIAYAVLYEAEPWAAAAALVRGYHGVNPLRESEIAALEPLVQARLAASLCYSTHNRLRNPDDPYQVVSEQAVQALIERLAARPPGAGREAIAEACGTAAS